MHLTGGLFKGRIISTPKGEKFNVRPTLSKVRESVFNILYSYYGDFSNLSFLDMFAGSGIMALEAYSRGFKNITAIENDSKAFCAAKKTFSLLDSSLSCGGINIIKGDSLKIVSKFEKFDVIYIDPPWEFDYEPIISCALEKLTPNGIIVAEYDKKLSNLPSAPAPFKEKIYGRTGINFYKK